MHGQFHLAADGQRRAQEHVQRVRDRALGGVLDRHHAIVGGAGVDLAKHLFDGGLRQAADGLPEVLVRGVLREGPRRAQIRHRERPLQGQAGRHDFPKNVRDRLVRQRPGIGGGHLAQHLRLALRTVEDRLAGGLLDLGHLLRAGRPLGQQAQQLTVDRVDTVPNLGQLAVLRHASSARLAPVRDSAPPARPQWRGSSPAVRPAADDPRPPACRRARPWTC